MTPVGTVYLVDDDAAARRGMERLLRAAGHVFRSWASAEESLAELDPAAAGCLLLDLKMPGKDGLELQEDLARRGIALPIVFLTGHGSVAASVRAMKAGAIDFLEKPAPARILLAAVAGALERDAASRQHRVELTELRNRAHSLTARELEVLAGVAAGRLNKQIAGDLGIALRTVKLHRANLVAKLQVSSVAGLVQAAERLGIVSRPNEPAEPAPKGR